MEVGQFMHDFNMAGFKKEMKLLMRIGKRFVGGKGECVSTAPSDWRFPLGRASG